MNPPGARGSVFTRRRHSGRTDSQREALEAEGLTFDEAGRADPAQHFDAEELATLAGVDPEDLFVPTQGDERESSFWAQLTQSQSAPTVSAVGELLNAWQSLGGRIEFGSAAETSCFLVANGPAGDIWPATLYPSGKFEVVFQHLTSRPPFDELALRDELRQRFNQVPGVDLPESKVSLRPGFALALLASVEAAERVNAALEWFVARLDGAKPAPNLADTTNWYVSFGDGLARSWADALKYGFISAGGGAWYSGTLCGVPRGARVLVHIANRGYVAVGETLAAARRFDEAEVLVDGVWESLPGMDLLAPYRHVSDSTEVTDENAEYVIPVRWLQAASLDGAYWEGGMFANQHSACLLTHQFTIERVERHFDVSDPT